MKLNSFAQNLKALREKNNLSQMDLTELCDFAHRTIARLENEQSQPRLSTLLKIADFFGVSLDELIRGNFLREWVLQKRTLRNKAAFKLQDNFAKNLKLLRKNAGFTTTDLAEFFELPVKTVKNYEDGEAHPPLLDVYIKIADFFAVTIDELVCGNAEDTLEMWSKRKHLFESLPLFERS